MSDKIISSIATSISNVVEATRQPSIVDEAKPILLICSKDLSSEKLTRFQRYGRVNVWNSTMLHHPFADLDKSDYLIMDYRNLEARTQLAKEDLSKYNVVHFVRYIQRVEDYIEQISGNVIHSIPKVQANKKEFDHQLLNQPLPEPSVVWSLIKRYALCSAT